MLLFTGCTPRLLSGFPKHYDSRDKRFGLQMVREGSAAAWRWENKTMFLFLRC